MRSRSSIGSGTDMGASDQNARISASGPGNENAPVRSDRDATLDPGAQTRRRAAACAATLLCLADSSDFADCSDFPKGWTYSGSNRGPLECDSSALPAELYALEGRGPYQSRGVMQGGP